MSLSHLGNHIYYKTTTVYMFLNCDAERKTQKKWCLPLGIYSFLDEVVFYSFKASSLSSLGEFFKGVI